MQKITLSGLALLVAVAGGYALVATNSVAQSQATGQSAVTKSIEANQGSVTRNDLEADYKKLEGRATEKTLRTLPASPSGATLAIPRGQALNQCHSAGCLCTGTFCADLIDKNYCKNFKCVRTNEGPLCLCEF